MGRRSVNSTKGGKYMNPTDQARKEARKKELKKNKKQRLMVRQAVLKGKDPAQLLEEMEKIDEMEFNVYQPSPLNEKVLKEKRKKLKETFDRVMRLYHSDSPEAWGDLKRKELDYELRRAKKEQYFESVKHAQSVAVDEIPLPQLPTEGGDGPTAPTASVPHRAPPVLLTNVPVPSFLQQQQQGILKKPSVELQQKLGERDKRDPPGCPMGPPPTLVLLRELDDDWEEEELVSQRSKLRFSDEEEISAQKRQAILAGKNIDDLMREVEHDQRKQKGRLHRSDEEDSDQDSTMDPEEHGHSDRSNHSDSEEVGDDDEEEEDDDEEEEREILSRRTATLPPVNPAPPPALSATLPPTLPPQIKLPPGPPQKHLVVPPPPPMGLPPRSGYHPPPPPPLRPGMTGMSLRMPGNRPGMPPGPPPPRMGMRMPPGPPPGMPLRMRHQHSHHHGHPGGYQQQQQQHHHHHHHHHQQQQQQHGNKDPKSVTITAKPQIRNLSADVTRFVPSTLRSKRGEEKGPQKPRHMMVPSLVKRPAQPPASGEGANKGKTKDDAYMQFMREMQGLL